MPALTAAAAALLVLTLVAWLVHYQAATIVGADNQPRGHWTANKNAGYGAATAILLIAVLISGMIAQAVAYHRYWGTVETKLSARYGHDIQRHDTRAGSYWTVDGIPAVCTLHGSLPEEPVLGCLGLDPLLQPEPPAATAPEDGQPSRTGTR